MPRLPLLLAVALLALPAEAQDAPLPETNAPYFAPLDLPTPNQYRSASGKPGPAYWQQEADYDIAVSLDPATNTVRGSETITYTNNSPDPLDFLWLSLEQNLFREGSRGALTTPAGTRFSGAFPGGGIELGTIAVRQGGQPYEPETLIDDTRLRIDLAEPMAPGGSTVTIDIAWSFRVPERGADRMGILPVEGGAVYEIAQWFPQVLVYDDVEGWNALPYLGQGEFYLGYGDYDVAITVPSEFVVVATGEQTNPEETWDAEQLGRLAEARRSAERVYIVRPEEAGTRPGGGTTTWRYRAEDVRDFAWAASQQFILDGAGYTTPAGNDVLILSAYPPEGVGSDPAEPGWEEATRFGRQSVQYNSEQWFPYPYPVAISVAGVVGGMEYPMIHFSDVTDRGFPLQGVVDHEVAHNWFPMIVGSDERRHVWMDEGFASFMNALSGPAFYDENADPTIAGYGRGAEVRMYRLTRSPYVAGRMQEALMADQPIATTSDAVRRAALGFLGYRKPSKGLQILRETILGPERFDEGFRAYTERWAFKHPQPADFFRTIEDVSGEELGWFWRAWFYSTDTLDQRIDGVREEDGQTVVSLSQAGGLLFPIDLELTFADGRTERRRVPAEAFFNADTFELGVEGRVTGVRLNPDGALPDTDLANDAFPMNGTTNGSNGN